MTRDCILVVVSPSCAVLIAPTNLLPQFTQRAALPDADVLGFADTDVLRALEAITARKPRLVALERLFAATPRGAALINRIKADPSLMQTELRGDPDAAEVVERPQPVASAPGVTVAEPESTAAPAEAPPRPSFVEAPWHGPPNEKGTRRAPRYQIARKLDFLVDGNPATLLDLSTCGAQVISPTILRPNQ